MMIEDKLKENIYKYLHRHFPVKRLKDNRTNKFKRGIMIWDSFGSHNLFFSPKTDATKLYAALYNDLDCVFGLNSEDITPIIFKYLYLDKYYKP